MSWIRRRLNMTKMNKEKAWLWEFSKKIVWIVTVMFVAVFLFSCIALIFYPDSTALQFLIDNISDVFKVTVVSYAVKAGFENITKIRGSYKYGVFNTTRRRTSSDDSGNTRCD